MRKSQRRRRKKVGIIFPQDSLFLPPHPPLPGMIPHLLDRAQSPILSTQSAFGYYGGRQFGAPLATRGFCYSGWGKVMCQSSSKIGDETVGFDCAGEWICFNPHRSLPFLSNSPLKGAADRLLLLGACHVVPFGEGKQCA